MDFFAALHLIERVGAYAGFVAFLGLAILALLYFSQARDVRRLREWAGRAPERASEAETRAQAATTATPARPPAPQTAAAQPTVRRLPPAQPAGAQPAVAAPAAAQSTAQRSAVKHPAAQRSYMPATPFRETELRRKRPMRERIRNIYIPQARYLVLAACAIVIMVGAAVAAFQLAGGGGGKTSVRQGHRASRNAVSVPGAVNVDPSQVTVAVLNGTGIAGLAAKVSDQLTTAGFVRGTVDNAAQENQTQTEVLYNPGQEAAARAVADRIGVKKIGKVDSVNRSIAGSFNILVLVGGDQG